MPYIVGEIKRFFRDTSWSVHVPRRLQEARLELAKANEELGTRLGRSPTVSEPATLMDLTEKEVVEVQIAANAYTTASLDAAINSDSDSDSDSDEGDATLAAFIGVEDPALELIEHFHALAPLIADLDEQDRRILHMRFVEERTQAQIGQELGPHPGLPPSGHADRLTVPGDCDSHLPAAGPPGMKRSSRLLTRDLVSSRRTCATPP